MSVSTISSSAQVGAGQASAPYSPEQAENIARARAFASVVTDDTRSVDDRVTAFNDYWRLNVAGRLYNAAPEDRKVFDAANKSTLMTEMQRLQEAWGDASFGTGDTYQVNIQAGLAYFDSLSTDEQTTLFAAINAPCYQDIGAIGKGVPPQRFNGVAEWRAGLEASALIEDYMQAVGDVDALTGSEKARWEKIQALQPTHDSNRDGSWAHEIKKLLAGGPVDRVDLSPAAKQAMSLLAPRSTTGAIDLEKEQPQTMAGVALQLLKGSMLNVEA